MASSSSNSTSSSIPLNVIIIGAGIGGFTAAAALRKQDFAYETGAAIHVGPNATRALDYLGYDPARLRGVLCYGVAIHESKDGTIVHTSYNEPNVKKVYGHPWYLAHRVDLHNEVKLLAMAPASDGPIPELHLSTRVTAVDPAGEVTVADGTVYQADLVVAADGVHSMIRENTFRGEKAYAVGDAAYRFVLDSKEIYDDPECLKLERGQGLCHLIVGPTKRVVIYPCRNDEVLNFVAIHESTGNDGSIEDWNQSATTEELVDKFSDFAPSVVACLKKARNVKHWQLLQRSKIPNWNENRVVLIGDAAHPLLPHQAQGGAQAIEDGVTLGPLFSGTTAQQVPEVLKLYQQCRYERGTALEKLSRIQRLGGSTTLDPRISQEYIMAHDAVALAKHMRSSVLLHNLD